MLAHFPVFELIVSFSNVTSSISMNMNPFMSFNRLSKCDSTNAFDFVRWFNGFELSWSSIPYDFACPLRAWFSSFILGIWSGLPVLGFGIGLYPSWNCSGGGNMRSSLTLLRGMGLSFTLSHFPVLGGGVGFFHWFINNLINSPLVSLLRFFFSISIYIYFFKYFSFISLL